MVAAVAKAIPRLVVVLALILPLVPVNRSQEPAGVSVAAVPRAESMRDAVPEEAGTRRDVLPGPELGRARVAGDSLGKTAEDGLARIGVGARGRVGAGGLGNLAVASVSREAVPGVSAERVSRRLDRFLRGRPGPVTAMVKDLATGRVYRYHAGERLITASTAKVQILMALLLRTPWKKLPAEVRRDAEMMIRYSDNHAADRLWTRIGGADGFNRAGKRLGLKHTVGVPGQCVDLYCWGITRTSVDDQVRLMAALVSGRSPLRAGDRKQVLRLMGEVVDGQNWGISAAACDGERVTLKNGWLKRVSTKRWAMISVGLIRDGDGRDYALAVLTEGSPEVAYGVATVEGVVERIMRDFRDCRA